MKTNNQNNKTFLVVEKKFHEITAIPPQQVGFLTPLYKRATSQIKVMPLPVYIVLSVVLIVMLSFVLGSRLPLLTGILQRGF